MTAGLGSENRFAQAAKGASETAVFRLLYKYQANKEKRNDDIGHGKD
jgi:hypothetical protein